MSPLQTFGEHTVRCLLVSAAFSPLLSSPHPFSVCGGISWAGKGCGQPERQCRGAKGVFGVSREAS